MKTKKYSTLLKHVCKSPQTTSTFFFVNEKKKLKQIQFFHKAALETKCFITTFLVYKGPTSKQNIRVKI